MFMEMINERVCPFQQFFFFNIANRCTVSNLKQTFQWKNNDEIQQITKWNKFVKIAISAVATIS